MSKNDFGQDGSVQGFFHWINERQRIYLKKEAGEPWPWTEDKIMQDYLFCNVYREQDTVTKWIAQNWRNKTCPPATMIFNMVVARFFNWPPTLKSIGWSRDWTIHRNGGVASDLIVDQQMGHKIFNDAYLIAGSDLKGKSKVEGVCERLDWAWEHRKMLAAAISIGETLEQAHKTLQGIPGVAGFIAYEIVTDLRHTPVLQNAPDIMTWANPGPGAVRGIQRIHGKHITSASGAIQRMRELLKDSKLWTKHGLEMRDIEHSLCEYDKYLRIKQAIAEDRPVLGMRKYRRKV